MGLFDLYKKLNDPIQEGIGDLWGMNPDGTRYKDVGKKKHGEDQTSGHTSNRDTNRGLLALSIKNKTNWTRQDVFRALDELKSENAVDLLIQALHDNDDEIREIAALVLGEIGSERAVGSLILALSDTKSDVQIQAAVALGKIKSEQAVEPLIQKLTDTQIRHNSVSNCDRYAMITALGEINSERAYNY
jgi:HEAT repeat protein